MQRPIFKLSEVTLANMSRIQKSSKQLQRRLSFRNPRLSLESIINEQLDEKREKKDDSVTKIYRTER